MRYVFECKDLEATHELQEHEKPLDVAKMIYEKEKSPVRFWPEEKEESEIIVSK